MSSDETNPRKKSFELSHLPIVLKAFKAGVEAALAEHKKQEQTVVIWRDGKVVEVPPEEIPDFPQEADQEKEKHSNSA